MPWKKSDVESHIKGLTSAQKEVWVEVANKALASCIADGGKDCEASAIRQANSVAQKVKESMEITEVGKTISAATESKLRAAISALQELLPSEEQESLSEKDKDPNVGGGVDREKILAEDFAGKNRSFPIVTPDDIADAASSIGRAGADNYDTNTLKANIIKIAKRKGKVFVAQLPEAWQEKESNSEDSEDGLSLKEESVELVEKAIAEDGSMLLKIIKPGWGSSGYYAREVLKRDGPRVFRRGLHMHMDHPTKEEEAQRPEGSTKDLVGVLIEDAKYEDNGPRGEGLYSRAQIFTQYRPLINEMAPYIGASIRAHGSAVRGEAEGHKGPLITEISKARTTDLVTTAGAGGEIVPLQESVNEAVSFIELFEDKNRMEVDYMNEEEAKALKEAKEQAEAENARLKEALLLREAEDFAREALAKIEMPDMTRDRLVATLAKSLPITEGKLDTEKFEAQIKEAARTELEYLASVSGSGAVRGMGSGGGGNGSSDLKESFKNLYARQGKSPEEAEKLAALASAGR